MSYSGHATTSTLAKKALCLMGEDIPRRLSPNVPNWKPLEVQTWLQQVGFATYCERFWVSGAGERTWSGGNLGVMRARNRDTGVTSGIWV